MNPRRDRIQWNDSYMLHAIIASWRSPDPNTQVGAAIVDPEKKTVVSTGYNGWPRGISTCALPWHRDREDPLENKYTYVVHAEKNAILNATKPVDGFHLYITMFPCNECAKDIIQAGIKEIVYLTNPYKDLWQTRAAEKMFDLLDIKRRQHIWNSEITTNYLRLLASQITLKQ